MKIYVLGVFLESNWLTSTAKTSKKMAEDIYLIWVWGSVRFKSNEKSKWRVSEIKLNELYNNNFRVDTISPPLILISIYKFSLSGCLFVCLFVCLYPINVKTAEPIRPKFFVGSLMSHKGRFTIKISKISLQQNLNVIKCWNPRFFFLQNPKTFCLFLFFNVHNWNRRWTRSALKA